jgi:hypothetical protein
MVERLERPYFEERQSFSWWIKVIVLLPVILFGSAAVFSWIDTTPIAIVPTLLALLFLLFAVPHFILKLVTRLDSTHLHLRIEPLRLPIPFAPPRMRDVPLTDISRWEVRTYRSLRDREYWGHHLWGLASASGRGRYLYIMKSGPFAGRGVQLELQNGDHLLLGSQHPENLARAINLAKSEAMESSLG